MAQAVKRLYPRAKFAIGPSIENGFYYDFDVNEKISNEQLEAIEKEMQKIAEEDLPVTRDVLAKKDALLEFEGKGEPYKTELINELGDEAISVYRQGEFVDLCRGPHVRSTAAIKSFKLLSVAGAYWRGDEKNKMLQRIYGIAFPDKKELKKYLDLLEEAKKRDHRVLGKELELFSFHNEVGAGLPLWHPNGAVLRFIIDKFTTQEHLKRGYNLFVVPHIAKSDLYKTSGHLGFYKENMYSPIQIDGQDYILKPMNCPSQIQDFHQHHPELPRPSVSRLRDGHCVPVREVRCTPRAHPGQGLHPGRRTYILSGGPDRGGDPGSVLEFTLDMLKVFGFEEKSIYLSTRPEKSVGTDRNWEIATSSLRQTLEKLKIPYKVDPGEGVFYGPKIDIKIKDALGREWQCSTIQVDFNLPERFDINYIGSDGQKHRPIMIHRALLGSLERFIGILIEHYSGKFPVWFAPVQAALLNITEDEAAFVRDLRQRMLGEELRADCDTRNESVGYKIREAISRKVPYIGVVGAKEVSDNTVSVRKRGESKSEIMKVDDFIQMIKDDVRLKR